MCGDRKSGGYYGAKTGQVAPPLRALPADNRGAPVAPGGAIKNDRNDAEAVATAARQGNMRFVGVKSGDQRARLSWHRVREGYKKDGLAVMNRIRGLLAEFGIVINKIGAALAKQLSW